MPLGFANSILTGTNVGANTRAATWTVLAGHDDFAFTESSQSFSNGAVMTKFDNLVNTTDSTIRIYPSNSSFKFNSNFNYTIEFWLGFTNLVSFPSSQDIFEITTDHTEGLEDETSQFGKITANSTNVLFFTQGNSATIANSAFASSLEHVALVGDADNNTQSWYLDGSRILHQSSYTHTGSEIGLALGMLGTRTVSNGRVLFDEVRVSDTVRYTGTSYTVPTSEFTTDENTLALFHCNDNILDSSRG